MRVEAVVGRGIEIGVLAAVVIAAVGARAGLDRARGVALIAAPHREQLDLRRIGRVVEAHAAQALLLDVALDQIGVVVLSVRPFRSREGPLGAGSGHQDPFLELAIVGELELAAGKSALVHHDRLERVGDLDHIAGLENEPPLADRHHLHLVAAMAAQSRRSRARRRLCRYMLRSRYFRLVGRGAG